MIRSTEGCRSNGFVARRHIGTTDAVGWLRDDRRRSGGFVLARSTATLGISCTASPLIGPRLRRGIAVGRHLRAPRAHANLRATIWRARIPGAELVRGSATHIAIGSGVDIDYHAAIGRARALLEGRDKAGTPQETNQFALDLLPGWGEEWVQLERERLRQLRLHTLEACCYHCIAAGDTARAIDFGLAAVSSAPLRESAQRSLMSAHIAEGNHAEALSVLDAFRRQLWASCGLHPSTLMEELVAPPPQRLRRRVAESDSRRLSSVARIGAIVRRRLMSAAFATRATALRNRVLSDVRVIARPSRGRRRPRRFAVVRSDVLTSRI